MFFFSFRRDSSMLVILIKVLMTWDSQQHVFCTFTLKSRAHAILSTNIATLASFYYNFMITRDVLQDLSSVTFLLTDYQFFHVIRVPICQKTIVQKYTQTLSTISANTSTFLQIAFSCLRRPKMKPCMHISDQSPYQMQQCKSALSHDHLEGIQTLKYAAWMTLVSLHGTFPPCNLLVTEFDLCTYLYQEPT